jgi:hypothetical protein
MADNDSLGILGEESGDRERTIETESRPREVLNAVTSRWISWAVVAVTAVTAYYLYTVGGGWTLDAITFALISVGLLAYTLFALNADIE